MARAWTYGRKIGAGFGVTVALTIAVGALSAYALQSVVASKDRVITVNAQLLIDAERLEASFEKKNAGVRGFLFAKEPYFIDQLARARADIAGTLAHLRQLAYTDAERRIVDAIGSFERDEHQQAIERLLALRRADAPADSIVKAYHEQVVPRRDELENMVKTFLARERKLLDDASQAATDASSRAVALIIAITIVALLLALAIAIVLTRALGQQVGDSVGKVQSSSAELQAAATQQATGSKEQATAMNEISTTITELLATSRQIAESAQRVAQIAQQAAASARSGETTVDRGNDAMAGTRRQIDLVVSHMLDLGKKSQQIGAVLEIVSELAEQTNILAINATIEAAGAGETGRRFAVVAEEIRKLADRVAGSTKQIRGLIDDVRGAVNTTVMTTETGSKAVDGGAKQFADVAIAFKQIVSLVTTTVDAAREIELSTKQQATAVEQVNVAIANVSQTTRETEASSAQSLQTASQLAGLSRELLRLVRADA